MEEERSGGFLPPEPAGPEPEMGQGAGRTPAEPPTQALPPASPQPPPGYGPPPGYAAPPGQAPPPPPGGWYQQPQAPGWQQPPPWGHPQQRAEPDNGPAVAGFVLSLVAGGLLLFSGGLSSIVSIGCAIAGIVYSRQGRQKVDSGETRKNRGLAQAGFVIGIVSLVLSLVATAFWVLILVLALNNEDFQQDLEDELDQSDTIRASVRLGLAAARVAFQLLG